ncbi:MAG: insulinase family protein [Clostridia bacterium]|nr:insulinase family protein [Clostridia bacterium]
MSAKITALSNGAQGVFIKNERFNTTLISFNFYMPLASQTVAEYALLPLILTTCSEKYSNFSKLNYKLSKLYGANLSASTEKVGDLQLLKIAVSVIEDRYTLDEESLLQSAVELLTSLVFEPKAENGAFCEEDVEREKRKAIEHIRGQIAEKRSYARQRMIEEMYKGKPYGVSKCGTESDVEKITGESLYNAWKRLLENAFIRVNVVSRNMPQGLFDEIGNRLSAIERTQITDCRATAPTRKAATVKTVDERMDIAQGKLVMGFSSRLHGEKDTASLTVMRDILGGGPYSKLFTNVREKLSLCYYCAASVVKVKGLLTVDSGVEAQNFDRAQKAILEQLDALKNGEIDDFEFEASKKSIIDSLKGYNDSQGALDLWYSLKIEDDTPEAPEEAVEQITKVTKKQVISAAQGVNLHTVYRLLPQDYNG